MLLAIIYIIGLIITIYICEYQVKDAPEPHKTSMRYDGIPICLFWPISAMFALLFWIFDKIENICG